MSVRRAVLDLLILFLVLPATRAALVNYTIDDTFGDSVTGAKPVYLPASPWAGPGCTTCEIVPVKALAFDGTWTAATYNPSLFNNMNITFSFTGISIWVFFILANNNTLPGVTSNTQCNFTLDGQLVNTFNHQPNESTNALQYNATAFTTSGLSNSQHTLVISTNDFPGFSFLNFDYAIYTADLPDSATISSSGTATGGRVSVTGTTEAAQSHPPAPLGIIIGCVLGGLALIVLAGVFILFRRLQKKQKAPTQQPISAFNQQPPQGYRGDPAMSNPHLLWQNSGGTDPSQGLMSSSTGAFHDQQNHFRSPSSDLGSDATTLLPVRREYQPLHAHSTKSRDELRTVRQMDINQRLQNAQLEIRNLTSRQTMHSGPGSSVSDVGRQETGHEMETMREQIRHLTSQIEQLQSERTSDWAQGLSDEPPPAYD